MESSGRLIPIDMVISLPDYGKSALTEIGIGFKKVDRLCFFASHQSAQNSDG
jgi:hypothetical protein